MKNRKRLFIGIGAAVVVLAVVVAVIFTTTNAANSPVRLLSLGEKYLTEMEYEQAIVQFLKVIEVEPKNAQAYLGAAEAYVALGREGEAIAILRKGLEQTNAPAIAAMLAELESRADAPVPTQSAEPAQAESIAPESTAAPYTVSELPNVTPSAADGSGAYVSSTPAAPAEATAPNIDVSEIVEFPISNFSYEIAWREDELVPDAIGWCSFNYDVVKSQLPASIRDKATYVYIPDFYPEEQGARNTQGLYEAVTKAFVNDPIYEGWNINAERRGNPQSYPIYKNDAGKTFNAILVALDSDKRVIGHTAPQKVVIPAIGTNVATVPAPTVEPALDISRIYNVYEYSDPNVTITRETRGNSSFMLQWIEISLPGDTTGVAYIVNGGFSLEREYITNESISYSADSLRNLQQQGFSEFPPVSSNNRFVTGGSVFLEDQLGTTLYALIYMLDSNLNPLGHAVVPVTYPASVE
jgi:tetratricopeptide (TPR) repeat protein